MVYWNVLLPLEQILVLLRFIVKSTVSADLWTLASESLHGSQG